MSAGLFTLRKALSVFGTTPEEAHKRGIKESDWPAFAKSASDNRTLKSWTCKELPDVGELVGFMQKPERPVAVAIFVTKGGVLKSSLTLNLARTAALHNIRTCVVGLDMQGDVTTALAAEALPDENESLDQAIERMNSLRGLPDLFTGEASLDELLRPTDIPTLFYIPETPELVALDQSLVNRNRREYWLRDQVIAPLKKQFDLIIMDCSPNWNRLITNALVACDTLVSPVECKINNFRNLSTFRALVKEFKEELQSEFAQVFIPTRLTPGRRLSQEIFSWYQENLPGCLANAVRESLQGEESMAMRQSLVEYASSSAPADEMRSLLNEMWESIRVHDRARASHGTASRSADLTI